MVNKVGDVKGTLAFIITVMVIAIAIVPEITQGIVIVILLPLINGVMASNLATKETKKELFWKPLLITLAIGGVALIFKILT